MQIVIDIDEDDYLMIKLVREHGMGSFAMDFILNGTVLPKHGRLIDGDKLLDTYYDLDYDLFDVLNKAPTILEATEGDNG